MNTYIKTLLDSFGNQLFPRTRVDAVYLEDNTTELGDHLQTKQDAPTLDKTTPVDGDKTLIYDSANSNAPKKLSWANIKATLKTYFDTLYGAKPTNQTSASANTVLKSNGDGTSNFTNIGYLIPTSSDKATPIDADTILLSDSAAGGIARKLTWANIKATLFGSPTFTGTPIAPTAVAGTNTTQIATTAFVQQEVATPTTLTHTQTEAIKSLPTGSLDGKVRNFKADGLSLVNSVVNGDFSNGTTGLITSSVLSVTDKVLTLTGDSTDTYDSYVGFPMSKYTANSKIFFYLKAMFLDADPYLGKVSIKNSSGNSMVEIQYGSKAINVWHELYGTLQHTTDVENAYFAFDQRYGTGLNDGKRAKIDGNAGVFAINMTTLGIESYTEAQMLDLVRGGYFDGLKGVENPTFESVGKNLFDGQMEIGSISTTTGLNQILSTSGRTKNFIKVKPNTNYFVYYGVTPSYRYFLYDSNFNFISTSIITTQTHFTTSSDTQYIRLHSGNFLTYVPLQIEQGTVATAYEAYKSSALSINETLRSLPNGIKDRVFEQDGQIWLEKNVAEYTLKASDISSISSGTTNQRIITINPIFTNISWIQGVEGKVIVPIYPKETNADIWDTTNETNSFQTGANGSIRFIVPLGTYASLALAQTTLAGTKIHYQLATPQLINLTTLGKADGELSSFANGTSYLGGDTFHVSSVEFTTPANVAAALKSLAEGDNYQAKQLAMKAIKPTNEATATANQILEANGDGTSTFVDFSGGGQLLGTATIKAISYNAQVINENITIPSNYNAMSVGPITVGDGYTLTIEDGAVYKVI